jgi:lipopolysaccharide export system protein LptA
VFTLEGGRDSPHPTGRARVVMMPRGAAAASAAESPASAVPLRPSLTLTPRKPS